MTTKSMFSSDYMGELPDLLSPYDSFDTLAVIAALQLIPDNASRGIRLEAASHALVSNSYTPSNLRITGHRLDTIFNNRRARGSWLCRQEDSVEGPFVEAVTYYGGSYNILPGLRESATFITRHLVSALFKSPQNDLPASFRRVARDLFFLCFKLTNRACQVASLRRNIAAKQSSNVLIPSAKGLEPLKSAVTFSQSELNQLEILHRSAIPRFRQLICRFASIQWGEYRPDSAPLTRHPIIQEGDNYVIAVPSYLIPSAEIEIRTLAHEIGLLSVVANLYRDAVWRTMREVVGYLGCVPVDIQLPALPNEFTCVAEGVFQMDTDKILYILLQTDPLEDFVISEPQNGWTLPSHDIVVRRLHEVRMT